MDRQTIRTSADAFADGLLGRLEMLVLTTIADSGPIDSRRLWRDVKRGFGGNRARFEQALGVLQAGFRVMVAGGDLTGWSLHRWDLVERLVPPGLLDDLPSREESRMALLAAVRGEHRGVHASGGRGLLSLGLEGTQALVDQRGGRRPSEAGGGGGVEGDLVVNSQLTIPGSEIRFRFSRSSGPGGQNVNKLETRVEILFDLAHSPSVTEVQRLLPHGAPGRVTWIPDGVVRLVVSDTRSQLQNRELAAGAPCGPPAPGAARAAVPAGQYAAARVRSRGG